MLIKKAQNTAEYAILIALVVAAAIGMQNYVKRESSSLYLRPMGSSRSSAGWRSQHLPLHCRR